MRWKIIAIRDSSFLHWHSFPLYYLNSLYRRQKKLSKSLPYDAKSKTSVHRHSNSWDCAEMISFALIKMQFFSMDMKLLHWYFCFFHRQIVCNVQYPSKKILVAMLQRFFKQLTKAHRNSTSMYDAWLNVSEWLNFAIYNIKSHVYQRFICINHLKICI